MSRMPNDDLFESTKMTFGEHLEELRACLMRALVGFVIGTIVGLLVAHHIVKYIQGPLRAALDEYYLTKAVDDLLAEYRGHVPPEMLTTIKEEGLVPSTLRLEAAGLVQGLKRADPELFGSVEYKPYRFVVDDIEPGGWSRLCGRLVQAAQSEKTSPAKFLWSLLEPDQQQLVRRVAEKKTPSEDEQRQLLRILNTLADNPAVYQSEPFRQLDGSPVVAESPVSPRALIERITHAHELHIQAIVDAVAELRREAQQCRQQGRSLDADKGRRLNKLLIASIFPDAIRTPRVHLLNVPMWKPTDVRVQALQAEEPFMIWLKAALITGFVLSSPWIFWQIWTFVAAGLYPHEKRYVYVYLPFSITLFLAGTALAFFFVFEPVLNFLFSFNKLMDIDPDPRISAWLSFVLFLPLGFGIAFQLPLVMLFLHRIGIFELEAYTSNWRIAILVIFVVSMVLTPADPISMLLMALPLSVLYFLGIALCKWMPRWRSPFADVYEP